MIKELTWLNLTPELKINDKNFKLTSGERISFELSKTRYCVGYKEFGSSKFFDCPLSAEIISGKETQCADCRQKGVSFAAKTGYGLSKQAGELLNSEHGVYLAYFADDTIKVGVAMWNRREIRVSEQGAIACLVIAKGNGTAARNLERRIHDRAGYTESVRLDSKLKGLCKGEPSDVRAQKNLFDAFEKVKELTPSTILLEKPEFIYLFNRYEVDELVFEKNIEFIKDINLGAKICGRLVGVYGKVILVAISHKIYAINSQLLAGFNTKPILGGEDCIEGAVVKELQIDRQQNMFDMY